MIIDFDPTYRFPCGFPGFLLRSRVGSSFPFASPNLSRLALALVEGSLVDSSSGGRAKTRMARIRVSPSKPGTGKMKLSKVYIQTKDT
jgi:hypothetical protein